MKQRASIVGLVFLMTCIIVVHSAASYHPVELEDGSEQMMNREPNSINGLWKQRTLPRRREFGNRRSSWRIKYPRKPRIPTKTTAAPKTTLLPTPGSEICRNHSKVSRIQDEPGPVVCLRRTSQELLKQLGSVGGLIKRYAAINQTDASAFEDLTAFQNGEPKTSTITRKSDEVSTKSSTTPSKYRVKRQAVNEKSAKRPKRSLPTSPGTVIRGCGDRGEIVNETNLHRLCTECAATTRLSDDRFPNYINEVICKDKDYQCALNIGICFQRTLQLSFLRFDGTFELDIQLSTLAGKTVYMEVWEPYTQEIRSCCECEMYPFIYHLLASWNDGDDDEN